MQGTKLQCLFSRDLRRSGINGVAGAHDAYIILQHNRAEKRLRVVERREMSLLITEIEAVLVGFGTGALSSYSRKTT